MFAARNMMFAASGDPLAGIPGLSFWDNRVKVFQDAAVTTPAANGDRVGGWVDRLTGLILSQATAGARPTRAAGLIVHGTDYSFSLGYSRSRTPEFSLIIKIKATTIGEQRRLFDLNFTRVAINTGLWNVLNESAGWGTGATITPVLNQTYIIRVIRSSATQVSMWVDGVLAGSVTGTQAADTVGLLSLMSGSFAGVALADRVLTNGEIAAVEAELSIL